MNNKYDVVVVGAGLFGSLYAYFAKQQGKSVLVIDKRSQVGGNLYCKEVAGINVHAYGAHIFHTSNKKVWDFVNSLVDFNRYTNSPMANYKGKMYNLPFNMNTFYQLWGVTTPEEATVKLEEQRSQVVKRLIEEGISEPRNLEEQALLLIGDDVYEKLIKGYTEKQWGRKCTELPAFIIKRLPVRLVYDNNYFNDKYQGIPIGGYNKLFDVLLADVDIILGVDFNQERSKWTGIAEQVVYTGMLDEYFDFCYGKLQYRTVRFEDELLDVPNYQGNAVINYTDAEIPYTRIIEHKHFEMFGKDVCKIPNTVVTREYSMEWKEGMEPYYPINDEHNTELAHKYRLLACQQKNIIFGGRLAEYRYYDMAPIVEKVMRMFDKF